MQELLAALVEHPDDLASWNVYADVLQTRGDPRGELISMMLRREQEPTPQLFEAQRRYLARHAATLAPHAVQVWRRGFPTELRITSPEQLAMLAEPTLRFVDTVMIAIEGGQWDAWATALAEQTWPWRGLVVSFRNPPEHLELRVLFAACPAVETARITLLYATVAPVWDNVHAPALQRLVLVDVGRVEALEADLPALRELWIIGESDVAESVCKRWQALERVVISSALENLPANTASYREPADRYDYAPSAFMIVGEPIELSLLQKVAARMTGLTQLSVRTAELWWVRRPVTVISLHGEQDPHTLLPHTLAVALENVLAPPPPIVLVAVDSNRGQFLALGNPEVRGQDEPTDATTTDVARRAFDVAFGCDPGSTIVDDILDLLAAAPEHALIGHTGGRMLSIIDPRAPTLEAQNAEEFADEEEDEEDEDYVDCDDDLETQYEEPPPLERALFRTQEDGPIEANVIVEADDEVGEEDDELSATDEVLDRPEAWFEFRENWDDRAIAPDNEPGDVRWPDPAFVENERGLDPERELATPACAQHGPFDVCSWCGTAVCWSCADTRVNGVCASCIVEIEQPSPSDAITHPR
ncbi:MAG TPA: TIGR02996 domain-containing protein, partial [Kofleriaceae bacterium]